jgi:hypothetical protein
MVLSPGKQGGNDTTGVISPYIKPKFGVCEQRDKISIKQSLGRVRTNGDTGKTVIKYYYRIPLTLIRKDGYPLNNYSAIE